MSRAPTDLVASLQASLPGPGRKGKPARRPAEDTGDLVHARADMKRQELEALLRELLSILHDGQAPVLDQVLLCSEPSKAQ